MAQYVKVQKNCLANRKKSLTRGSGSIVDHENDEQLESSAYAHELRIPAVAPEAAGLEQRKSAVS
jgi:hypothetical protein